VMIWTGNQGVRKWFKSNYGSVLVGVRWLLAQPVQCDEMNLQRCAPARYCQYLGLEQYLNKLSLQSLNFHILGPRIWPAVYTVILEIHVVTLLQWITVRIFPHIL
jgi:hypothetical protein